ncbi:MAG: DUF1674 domain-containing protein [Alphaproteobacteria bacterium]|nr:DUF1674 domain-containing protein [Alphaproteobacteria bacterium]
MPCFILITATSRIISKRFAIKSTNTSSSASIRARKGAIISFVSELIAFAVSISHISSMDTQKKNPEKIKKATPQEVAKPQEHGGRDGPEPTRFGDWELAGKCVDF